jgi:hypothetical protein
MKRALLTGIAAALCFFTTSHGRAAAPQDDSSPTVQVAITEIQAKLFFSNTGRFSSNLFEKKDVVLQNVIIGEGAGLEGPSGNTLLIVRVSGPPKSSVDGLKLHVTAKTQTRVLLDRECEVGIFNGNGNWSAPFLLYDTGCEPVIFGASLGPAEKPQVISGTIPFACSE